MMPQKFREMVLQMLYSSEYSKEEEELVSLMMAELKITKRYAKEAYQRVQLILGRLAAIDERIRNVSTEYQFERISCVEKNIIRLGVFELDEGLSPAVVLSEAVRLCRKFGTPSSADFVHAILGTQCSKSDSSPVGDLATIPPSE